MRLLLNVMNLVLFHLCTATLILLAKQQGGVSILEQHFLLSRSHLVDAIISVEHDGARDPKRNTRRDESVDFIDDESTSVRIVFAINLMFIRRVPIVRAASKWLSIK